MIDKECIAFSVKLSDGSMRSQPFHNMAPFLKNEIFTHINFDFHRAEYHSTLG